MDTFEATLPKLDADTMTIESDWLNNDAILTLVTLLSMPLSKTIFSSSWMVFKKDELKRASDGSLLMKKKQRKALFKVTGIYEHNKNPWNRILCTDTLSL